MPARHCVQAAGACPTAAAAAVGRRLFGTQPAAGQPQDKILLRGLVFHGYHGVYPEVRRASCWPCLTWQVHLPLEHRRCALSHPPPLPSLS